METGIQVGTSTTAGAKRTTSQVGDIPGNSSLTFSGSEDLGSGMKAMFQIQTTVANDAGSPISGYQSFIGAEGGFGEVKLGRFAAPGSLVVFNYDPSGAWGSSRLTQRAVAGQGGTFFPNNTVQYSLPKIIDGLSGVYSQSFGEAATGSTSVGSVTSYGLGYKVGGLSLDYVDASTKTSATVNTTLTAMGASYDFGVAALKLSQLSTKVGTAASIAATGYGVSVPMGAFKITVGQTSDNNTVKVSATEVLIQYALSKRTSLYFLNSSSTGSNAAATEAIAAGNKADYNRLTLSHAF
jgi:predicted porin